MNLSKNHGLKCRTNEKINQFVIFACMVLSSESWGQSMSKKGAQTMHLLVPFINIAGELTLHSTINLGGEGALAVEAISKPSQEEASKNDPDMNSRLAKAQAFSLLYSNFADPHMMSGFYWAAGAGYRTEKVDWLKPDKTEGVLLMPGEVPSYQSRIAELKGPTAHGRFGYRYVGREFPMLIGIFMGLRHFASSVDDVGGESSVRTDKSSPKSVQKMPPLQAGELTNTEKEKLKNLYATRGEGGIEIGFSF